MKTAEAKTHSTQKNTANNSTEASFFLPQKENYFFNISKAPLQISKQAGIPDAGVSCPSQSELNSIERRFHQMISNARAEGYNTAADNLQYFLDGTGADRRIPESWLQRFSEMRMAENMNKHRFENTIKERALTMPSGTIATFADHWDASVTGSFGSELYYASGTSTLTSTGAFTLTKVGNRIDISGTMSNHWHDDYNWNANSGAYIPGTGRVSDEEGGALQLCRNARPFAMYSDWNRTLTGHYFIDNFLYFDDSSFSWV
jgi:hypothetical protein